MIPDLFLKLLMKIYYPNPVDIVLQIQKEEPEYNFKLHSKNTEIKKELKRRQTIGSIEERKLILEEKKKTNQ